MKMNTETARHDISPLAGDMIRQGRVEARESAKDAARELWLEDCVEHLAFHDADRTADLMDIVGNDFCQGRRIETAIRERNVVQLSRILEWAAREYLAENPDYLDQYIEMKVED